MRAFEAVVQGRMNCSGLDGEPVRVPRGRCTIEAHEGFASVSWVEGGREKTVVIEARQFEEHLESGAVLIVNSTPFARPRESVPSASEG